MSAAPVPHSVHHTVAEDSVATTRSSVFGVLVAEGLRERRFTIASWGGSFGAMGILMVLVWPSIEDTISKVAASYPKALMEAFGVQGMNTIEQYVDGELFGLLVPLAAAVLVVRCVLRPIVDAEDAGQLDTWMAMPVGRRTLAWSSFAIAGVVLAATLAVMWALTMVASVVSGAGLDAAVLGRGVVNVWPLAMFFAGLAMVSAGAMRGAARANAVALGALVAMYLLDLAGRLAASVSELRYLSAFRLYGSAIADGLDASHVAGLTAAALLLAWVGALLFQRRDL